MMSFLRRLFFPFFFFNDTATTEIYTLSLHDALPICEHPTRSEPTSPGPWVTAIPSRSASPTPASASAFSTTGTITSRCRRERSEEHTSELQSPCNLVCRLLLEKKKRRMTSHSLLREA